MNTTPYRNDGTFKASFFHSAAGGLQRLRVDLGLWQKKYATLMKLDSTTVGLLGELDIMLQVVDQLQADQEADAKLQKARDKDLASKLPPKQTAFEKMHKKYKASKRRN